MEPTQQDIAAVSAAMGISNQPAPIQTQPSPQSQPAAQPAANTQPTAQVSTDPFEQLFQTPTEPTQPTQQPSQPTEFTPNPQPLGTPTEPYQSAPQTPPQPTQPVQQTQQSAAPTQQTYEQYIDSITAGIPQNPSMPDPNSVDPNSEEGINQFFSDLVQTAVQQAEANLARKQAIQTTEKKLWDDTFETYPSLRSNTQLRDMVHAVRMGEFNKGIAITPTQAAERVLSALKAQYQRGVADNQVVTTIEQVQPNAGGGIDVPTTMDADRALLAVQTGGENALAQILDGKIKAGNL